MKAATSNSLGISARALFKKANIADRLSPRSAATVRSSGIKKIKQGMSFSPFSFGREAGDAGLREESIFLVCAPSSASGISKTK
jgi:hypothetical protein